QRDFAAAERDLQQALALQPDDTARYGILVNRGTLRLRQGRVADAEVDLQEATRLQPGAFVAYVNLAFVAHEQDQLDKAIELLGTALALPGLGDSARLDLLRTRARYYLEKHADAEALTDLERALPLATALHRRPECADAAIERG